MSKTLRSRRIVLSTVLAILYAQLLYGLASGRTTVGLLMPSLLRIEPRTLPSYFSAGTRLFLALSIFVLFDILSRLCFDRWLRTLGLVTAVYVALAVSHEFNFDSREISPMVFKDIAAGIIFFYVSVAILRVLRVQPSPQSSNTAALPVPLTQPGTVEQNALGAGQTPLDRVARALLRRSMESETAARWGMLIMIVLVLVGGGASIGFWFQSQESRIRDLAEERGQLSRLAIKLDDAVAQTKDPGIAKDWTELGQSLKNSLATTKSSEALYQQLLNEARISEKTSWQDIAIRATIAILTLFLVQIFFSVFRYNRSLSNLLAAKAEALELTKDDPEAVHQLRLQVTSVLSASLPSFSSGPRTPLDSLVDAAKSLASKRDSSSK